MNDDTISRQAAIDALWKALYEYEDRTEKQFQESADLDVGDWIGHRIFVQNMSDIDRQTILNLPSAEKTGKWIVHTDKFANGAEYFGYAGYATCSECGDMIYVIDTRGNKPIWNYCPHCGARMVE